MDALVWFNAAIFASIVSPLKGWKVMGVRMCQEQCQYRRGCVALTFDAAHLMCTLVTKRTDSRAYSTLPVLKSLEREAVLKACHQNDRLVVNKKKQPICVPTTETASKVGYVILVPLESQRKLFFKFSVKGGKAAAVRLKFMYIRAVVYLKDRNRIVLAQRTTICSTSVNFIGTKRIRTITLSNLLTDEEENHLFFTNTEIVKARVSRMTLKGHKLSEIFQIWFSYDFLMGIDTKNNRIIICADKTFLSYTYDGAKTIMQIPKSRMKLSALAFCCKTSSLYYATGRIIMKVSKGKTTEVARIKLPSTHFSASGMIIVENHFYIIGFGQDHVAIRLDLSGQHLKVITLPRKQSRRISLAIVGVAQN